MAITKASNDVTIGKFDILATYTYAHELLAGRDDDEARTRGMVAAVMGARAKQGHVHHGHASDDFAARKEAAEKKKKSTITAASFDHQVADKLGPFFAETFFPRIKTLVEAGLSYDEVKDVLQIPKTWGAKIRGDQFLARVDGYLSVIKKKR